MFRDLPKDVWRKDGHWLPEGTGLPQPSSVRLFKQDEGASPHDEGIVFCLDAILFASTVPRERFLLLSIESFASPHSLDNQ